MNELVFALALKTDKSFVVVDGPFATRYDALSYKTDMQEVVKLSKDNFNKAMQWGK
jgi:hypothetical protein